ncbi:hypothetical protein [Desulfogranum mediterraneum]|uniref:hypothetical protein n=1 Tax=Desulfogranum mediterraneum TaxID=160661 RepID=UPI000402C016|nr:hypothetical protein [Desulfogranum mediterraneum]
MKIIATIVLLGALLVPSVGQAGVYTDDLSRCLVEASSPEDKITLVRWMFSAMALHPAVQTIAPVDPAVRQLTDKGMAELIVKLTSVTCLEQTRKAIQYEGPIALNASFNVFGQVAAQELFSNPEVARGIAGLGKFIDTEKLNKTLGIAKQSND